MKAISHKMEYRVLYADTDSMGVMYYANYLRIYEAGRGDFLRKIGFSFHTMEKDGVICPALQVDIKYINFAKFDQVVKIVTSINKKPIVKMEFIQQMFDENNNLLNSATVTIGFLNLKTGKLTRCPRKLLDLFT